MRNILENNLTIAHFSAMISNRLCVRDERNYMETVRFDELNLYPQILRGIQEMGFEEATPIQSKAIPIVMEGVDVIGQAPEKQRHLEFRC